MPDRNYGLGRLPAKDPRDLRFLMAAVVEPDDVPLRTLYWPMFDKVLDQGALPHCVSYAWHHFLISAPVTSQAESYSSDQLTAFYRECQENDEWDGSDYQGTSVRAGAKVLQSRGIIGEYRWALNAAEARAFLLSRGPVIVGTNWYDGMFDPGPDGFIKPTGPIVGGHAYQLIGYSVARDAVRIANSWGADWGQTGRCWLSFSDLDRLIREDGEACSAMEIRRT
jgi:hypothetical protein